MKVIFKLFFVLILAFLLLSRITSGRNVLFRLPIKNLHKAVKVTKYSKVSKSILSYILKKPRQIEKVITKTLDNAVDAASVLPLMKKSKFSQYVDKLFDEADTNKDEHVYFAEVYELVLKLYVHINRQAPIPPPSKEQVIILYLEADKTQNNRLTRQEFNDLAHVIGQRAMSRLLANRILTLIGAPLLAEYLVRSLSGKEWVLKLAKTIIPTKYQDQILPTLSSKAFCRTILIILLVETLGDVVLSIVDWVLNKSLPNENDHPRVKSFIGHYYLSNNMSTNSRELER